MYILALYPGRCRGAEKTAWYRLFAHALAFTRFSGNLDNTVHCILYIAIVLCTLVSGIPGHVNAERVFKQGMPFALERFSRKYQFHLLIQQILLGVFLEINEIYAHVRTVDTRPSFLPLQQPGYENNIIVYTAQ